MKYPVINTPKSKRKNEKNNLIIEEKQIAVKKSF
jgi:hypothetical protein